MGTAQERLYASWAQQDRYRYTARSPFRSAVCQDLKSPDFTSNYRKRLGTEWVPVTTSRPDPPLLVQPAEIYHTHVGHIPNYGGHIPGAVFRFGKTFGTDTKDAKRWLRGDFSV
ncbi:UPF0605 protein CG18335 [Agrilus planipennis]|uniref:UPF0605 protein CG18335 n=1 Tax=Agrilus planipennis TaxID=224129 RepID=A0A1W4X856_AGRPL|nr:UPF0605 protein CG18335 [Agrilus planipennis]